MISPLLSMPEGMGVNPVFSIVVPTCDRPGMLARAIASVAAQTETRWALIVVDDGTGAPASPHSGEWGAQARLIITGGRVGAAAARNLGMADAETEWIVFLDDDDEMCPDFLANLWNAVSGRPDQPTLAITDFEVIDYDENNAVVRRRSRKYLPTPEPSEQNCHQAMRAGACGLAINRAALAAAGTMDPTYKQVEDTEWILRLLEVGTMPVFVQKKGLIIHNHTQNERLSDRDKFYKRIEECWRLKARYGTLGGRFAGLPDLLNAFIAGFVEKAVAP